MKRLIAGLLLTTMVVLAGCQQGTAGGPGAVGTTDSSGSTSPPEKKPTFGLADDTFSLAVPLLTTSLKQGERKSVSISIKRGKNFDEDVTIKFAELPKGLTLDPSEPVIKHGDQEAKLMVKASDSAALGDFSLSVTGHPTKGADASNQFKINVEKK